MIILLSCSQGERTLKIKGSDTEVNLVAELAENYHQTNKQAFLSVSGGGSGLGIASLINGQADIANSSRELNEIEKQMFRERGIELDTFLFAEDAIAFIVSPTLSLDTLTVDDLAAVLSGKVSNWKSLTDSSLSINIYGRQSNSGTYEFVKNKLHIQFSTSAKEMNGNAQIIEAIKSDASGIGYVGAGYVMNNRNGLNSKVKVLAISPAKGQLAQSPIDTSAIFNHDYFFRRYLFQFIRRSSSKVAEPFIAFEKSEAGIRMIRNAGYYPVTKF
jgi:phosphate transport system substrate-binding protein